jgi:sRNA-binding protein
MPNSWAMARWLVFTRSMAPTSRLRHRWWLDVILGQTRVDHAGQVAGAIRRRGVPTERAVEECQGDQRDERASNRKDQILGRVS